MGKDDDDDDNRDEKAKKKEKSKSSSKESKKLDNKASKSSSDDKAVKKVKKDDDGKKSSSSKKDKKDGKKSSSKKDKDDTKKSSKKEKSEKDKLKKDKKKSDKKEKRKDADEDKETRHDVEGKAAKSTKSSSDKTKERKASLHDKIKSSEKKKEKEKEKERDDKSKRSDRSKRSDEAESDTKSKGASKKKTSLDKASSHELTSRLKKAKKAHKASAKTAKSKEKGEEVAPHSTSSSRTTDKDKRKDRSTAKKSKSTKKEKKTLSKDKKSKTKSDTKTTSTAAEERLCHSLNIRSNPSAKSAQSPSLEDRDESSSQSVSSIVESNVVTKTTPIADRIDRSPSIPVSRSTALKPSPHQTNSDSDESSSESSQSTVEEKAGASLNPSSPRHFSPGPPDNLRKNAAAELNPLSKEDSSDSEDSSSQSNESASERNIDSKPNPATALACDRFSPGDAEENRNLQPKPGLPGKDGSDHSSQSSQSSTEDNVGNGLSSRAAAENGAPLPRVENKTWTSRQISLHSGGENDSDESSRSSQSMTPDSTAKQPSVTVVDKNSNEQPAPAYIKEQTTSQLATKALGDNDESDRLRQSIPSTHLFAQNESSRSSDSSQSSRVFTEGAEKDKPSHPTVQDMVLQPPPAATIDKNSKSFQSSDSELFQPMNGKDTISPTVVENSGKKLKPVVGSNDNRESQCTDSSNSSSAYIDEGRIKQSSRTSRSSEPAAKDMGSYPIVTPTNDETQPSHSLRYMSDDRAAKSPVAQSRVAVATDGVTEPNTSVATNGTCEEDRDDKFSDRDKSDDQSSQSSDSSQPVPKSPVVKASVSFAVPGEDGSVDKGNKKSDDNERSSLPEPLFEWNAFQEFLRDCSLEVNHPNQPPVAKKGNFQKYEHPNFCLTADAEVEEEEGEEDQCLLLRAEGKGGRCELRHHAHWGVAAARYSTCREGVILCSTTLCLSPSPDPYPIDSVTLLQIIHTSYDLPTSGASPGGAKSMQLFAKIPLLRIVWCRDEDQDEEYSLWAHIKRQNKERRYKVGPKEPGVYFDLDIWIVFDPDSESYELGIDLDEDNCVMKEIDDWLDLTPTNYFQIGCNISDTDASPGSSAQVLYQKLDINIPTGEPLDDEEETDDDSDSDESDSEEEETSWAEGSDYEKVQESTNCGEDEEGWEEQSVSNDENSSSSSNSESSDDDEDDEHYWDETSVLDDEEDEEYIEEGEGNPEESSAVSDADEWAEVPVSDDELKEEQKAEEAAESTEYSEPKPGRDTDYDDVWAEISVSDDEHGGAMNEYTDEGMDDYSEYSLGSEITINSTGSAFYLPVDESEANDLLKLAERRKVELVIARQRMAEKEDSRGYSKIATCTDLSVSLYQAVKNACAGTRVFVLGKKVKKKVKDGDMVGYMRYGKGDNVRKVSFQTCKKTSLNQAIDEVLPVTEQILPVLISYEQVVNFGEDEEELSD